MKRNVPVSPYTVGLPVSDPAYFYGRRAQLETLFERLYRRQVSPICVRGLRRSGKTSFLRHAANPSVSRRWLRHFSHPSSIAYVDLLADVRNPEDFYGAVVEALQEVAPPGVGRPGSTSDFRSLKSYLKKFASRSRSVVMLDELERLAESGEFDYNFWDGLRSLASDNLIVWITASYHTVLELTRSPSRGGTKLTSPFANIFDSRPIIVGPLDPDDAEALVRRPAEKQGIRLLPAEVRAICRIAGGLPFILQIVAERWLFTRRLGLSTEACAERVLAELLDPRGTICDLFGSHWRLLDLAEQRCLSHAAKGTGPAEHVPDQGAASLLEDFGLLHSEEGRLRPAGDLLRTWLGAANAGDRRRGVFIGHGHNNAWARLHHFLERNLRLHPLLYEEMPREGQSIVPILEHLVGQADFAVILMTAEDVMADGKKRARQNVVHEAGFCQGRLGFERVVLLKQKGLEDISNLSGLQFIEFEGDRIEDAFPALVGFFLQ